MPKLQGALIVITGPSGVGKGALLQALCDRYPDYFQFSISVTTRLPRPHELDGREYFFWSRERFVVEKEQGFFLEWAEYAGNLYGTPKTNVEQCIAIGKCILLEIDLLGARQIASTFPEAKKIFIAPPSMEVLEERLRRRSTENEAVIERRLAHAAIEIAAAPEFDYVIINDDFAEALEALEEAIFGYCCNQLEDELWEKP